MLQVELAVLVLRLDEVLLVTISKLVANILRRGELVVLVVI